VSAREANKCAQAERLVSEFWGRVWTPNPDLTAIDELLVDDFVLTTAGSEVKGRHAFKEWVSDPLLSFSGLPRLE
jgi:hypothetical protein